MPHDSANKDGDGITPSFELLSLFENDTFCPSIKNIIPEASDEASYNEKA
jgi:hypothetical protein